MQYTIDACDVKKLRKNSREALLFVIINYQLDKARSAFSRMTDSSSYYKQSDSRHSLVSHFWSMQENKDGTYPLYATVQWGIIFSDLDGTRAGTLIGPRLDPTLTHFKAGEQFIGMVFHGGTSLNGVSKVELLNKTQPIQMSGYDEFLMQGKKFHIPAYDNLDALIDKMVNSGILSTAPIAAVSHRDKQRKIKKYTGLSPKQVEQATRVEHAIDLLSKSAKLSTVASQAGFSDQAHMTRDFRKFVGLTPSEIAAYFSKPSSL